MPAKNVGIYGGSFNPVHFGHVRLASHIRQAAGLDEVWFMVSPQNPFKADQSLLADEERLELTRLALLRHPHLLASDYEFRLPRPSYTWNTLQALSGDFPDCRFTLIIGADNWLSFPRWYRHDDILRRHDIIIFPRQGSPVDAGQLPEGVSMINTPLIRISSTDIRQRIAQGRSIRGLVPRPVERRILGQGFYRDNE